MYRLTSTNLVATPTPFKKYSHSLIENKLFKFEATVFEKWAYFAKINITFTCPCEMVSYSNNLTCKPCLKRIVLVKSWPIQHLLQYMHGRIVRYNKELVYLHFIGLSFIECISALLKKKNPYLKCHIFHSNMLLAVPLSNK
jgi:hypothetical protein